MTSESMLWFTTGLLVFCLFTTYALYWWGMMLERENKKLRKELEGWYSTDESHWRRIVQEKEREIEQLKQLFASQENGTNICTPYTNNSSFRR